MQGPTRKRERLGAPWVVESQRRKAPRSRFYLKPYSQSSQLSCSISTGRPRRRPQGPKTAQKHLQDVLRPPQDGSRRPKGVQKRLQDVLRPPQDGPIKPEDASKASCGRRKKAQDGPRRPKKQILFETLQSVQSVELFNFNRRPGRGSAKERQRASNPYF